VSEPRPVDEVTAEIKALRRAGRLAEAVALVDGLGQYGVNDDEDWDTSLGANVLNAYGDQLAEDEPELAREAYRRAAQLQWAFAATSTSGGEGMARSETARMFERKAGD
jgi:hypothetical protein